MYLKITNEKENHHGLQYHDGLNIDFIPFEREGSCCPGGIYFTTPEYICGFVNIGVYVREVTIPDGADMVMDPEGCKWRTSKVILGPRKDLRDVETWKWLVEIGANIHDFHECALSWSCANGYIEVVRYLIENGADINSRDDEPLFYACANGYIEVVRYLIENGANINSRDGCDSVFRAADRNGYLEITKYLKSLSVS